MDQAVLPLISTTAHPVVDPERGCLWSVSRDVLTGAVSVIRYDGTGTRVHRWDVENAALPQATHTITQTRDWLVLADTAYRIDPEEVFGGERTVANNPDGPVLLIRKDDLAPGRGTVTCKEFRIAPEVNHFYARYDDTDGVQVVMEHSEGVDIGMYLREDDIDLFGRPIDPALRGMYCHGMTPRSRPSCGSTPRPARCGNTHAPATRNGGGRPHRPVALPRRGDPGRPRHPRPRRPQGPVRMDVRARRLPHVAGIRPTRPGGTRYAGTDPGGHHGYLVVAVHNDDRFRIELFDAADVGRGPIAVLAPPNGTTMPFLIHSAWMPEAVPAPNLERHSFADDLDARLDQLAADLAATAREVAADLTSR
ncbi:carotenoid oxygenase family protein [Actinomadura sp. 3N407]|uniref:carotenoid oxygenase family protein n=1 Tax=Actinomadura sp. 3N407 TaxID=3457423 RepID=UPI003FCCC5C8